MPPSIDERIQAALEFAKHIHKPDGLIPSLSDGDARSFVDVLRQGFYLYEDEELAYVAWYSAGLQVLDLDNLRTDGSLPVIGEFQTNANLSPLAGYVGNQGVYPNLGVDRILLSDTQNGLFIVDGTAVVPLLGDLNLDRQRTAADIDLLASFIRGTTENLNFDLNRDGVVNLDDHFFLI